MFPKKNRLSKSVDVNLTTSRGRTFFSQSFLLKFLSKPELTSTQVGVIVSAKVTKSAVIRNRLKRLVRAELYDLLPVMKPGFYVIILKRTAVSNEASDLRNEIKNSLIKSKVLLK